MLEAIYYGTTFKCACHCISSAAVRLEIQSTDSFFENAYLFFGLSFLDIISPNFDARSQDTSSEICHVDTQKVRHLLSS